ncbi:MAG: hypothetical protein ACQETH_16925, partial [Candidatus Rifleibacteriota bacterium]
LFIALMLMTLLSLPAMAGQLNLVYEQVVKDQYGNEIGYRSHRIDSLNDLPYSSPWRDYLNEKLPDGKTIYEYARDTAPYLSKNLNFTISDRDSVSYSSKDSSGYNINLYDYVTRFTNDESKTFLFLHEFGHVAMLNSYPPNYDFVGLDYGPDNRHYIDEILPNANTAWVEGWANGFAANRNNGKVFTLDLNNQNVIAFLQNNNFSEMVHNELFVGKFLFDSIKQINSGKTKLFDVIARSGPHYSLREFCRNFSVMYPDDKVNMARILVENSFGNITLDELLDYVNGGSKTVSRELYDYLASVGMVKSTSGSNQTAQTNNDSGGSFWDRIFGWFANLFGRGDKTPPVASAPDASIEVGIPGDSETPSPVTTPGSATAPELPTTGSTTYLADVDDLATAQELYYKAFAEYNRLLTTEGATQQEKQDALQKLQLAKAKVKELRQRMRKGN